MNNDPKSDPKKAQRYWLAGGTKPLPYVTEAAMRFAAEHGRLLDLDIFFKDLTVRAMRQLQTGSDPDLAGLVSGAKEHEAFLVEVSLSRVVDNFLSFLSDLLALIYKSRPEMLRSSEQERLEFVLQFPTMDELRAALAEKRVERLAYLGLRELSEYVEKNMAFHLFPDSAHLTRAAVLVEQRNLVVHNRGVISALSARRFPQWKSLVGQRINLEHSEFRDSRQFLENAVFDIDLRAATKFLLPAIQLPDPPPDLIG